MRHAHQLRPVGPGLWPGYWIYVQAAVSRHHESDSDDYGHYRCEAIHARCYAGEQRTGGPISVLSTHFPGEFWKWVDNNVPMGKTVTMLSACAREQAAILGTWDRVLDGSIALQATLDKCNEVESSVQSEQRKGYVILAGPPTVIRLFLPNGGNWITWLDPENYGCASPVGSESEPWVVPDDLWKLDNRSVLLVMLLQSQVQAVRNWHLHYLDALKSVGSVTQRNTAASQARDCWQAGYMTHRVVIHDSQAVIDLERKALHGGRNEVYYLGELYAGDPPASVEIPADDGPETVVLGNLYGPTDVKTWAERPRAVRGNVGTVYHLDVNSLYPAVARMACLPVRLECVADNVPIPTLLAAAKGKPCVADVLVHTEEPCVPFNHEGRVIYPIGDFRTTLCSPEINLLAECGRIVSCYRLALYEGRPIYTAWVDRLYTLRQEASQAGEHSIADVLKSLLNTSFGKWAQRDTRWLDRPDRVCPYPFSQWVSDGDTWRSFAWHVQQQLTHDDDGRPLEPSDSFPAITATINSLGRVRLWKLMQTAGIENVYYVDTDSLMVSKEGYYQLVDAGLVDAFTLGKLKQEGAHDYARFDGQKRYRLDNRVVCSGVDGHTVAVDDTYATVVKAPPTGHYLHAHQPPGLDRVQARVCLRPPYLVGVVMSTGRVRPHRVK